MNQKIISAIIYLQSLLEESEIASLTIHMNQEQTNVISMHEIDGSADEIRIMYKEDYSVNPIKDMFEHIDEEMCTDCIANDYLYRDPFFKSLTKAYIDGIIHEFGLEVAIPNELAKAIIVHKLCDHAVFMRLNDDVMLLTEDNLHLTEGSAKAYLKGGLHVPE